MDLLIVTNQTGLKRFSPVGLALPWRLGFCPETLSSSPRGSTHGLFHHVDLFLERGG